MHLIKLEGRPLEEDVLVVLRARDGTVRARLPHVTRVDVCAVSINRAQARSFFICTFAPISTFIMYDNMIV